MSRHLRTDDGGGDPSDRSVAPGRATATGPVAPGDDTVGQWFLVPDERGNPDTDIDRRRDDGTAWTDGNDATPLVHGAEYFPRLLEAASALHAGDLLLFTDWRGDADQRLGEHTGTELGAVFAGLAERGVDVRGLVWRSHPDEAHLSEEEAIHLAEVVNEAGGEVLLDERVRRGGSHHQKLVLVRHTGGCAGDGEGRGAGDVAFVGGIDLCHGRRDDHGHRGDPQPIDVGDRYGDRPPWHDVQLEVRGPAVDDLAHTFRERWDDPTPLDHRNPWRSRIARLVHEPRCPDPLPPAPPAPDPVGPHAVQVLRTYPRKRPRYPFARDGERSIARAYVKAFGRARRLIYIEDQYLWSAHVTEALADALGRHPDLLLIALVPRYPEHGGAIAEPSERVGHEQAVSGLRQVAGDRVAVYDLENHAGTPVYVHAKVCIVDDTWAMIGSDNMNLRSWTHDSELGCAVLDATRDRREPVDPAGLGDGARRFARDLRLRLTGEHLDRRPDDPDLVDPGAAFAAWRDTADALARWDAGGRRGARPPGRVLPHRPQELRAWQRPWASVLYRAFVDPDGRPRALRRDGRF